MNTTSTAETWVAHESCWLAAHQEHVEAWLEQEGAAGSESWDVWRVAAWALLRVPEARGEARAPGDPDREPDSWDEIDAYEILFCHVVHGGCEYEPREYLRLMGSFAAFLGEQGVIGSVEHAALQHEWGVWSERLLEVWERSGWYLRDGIRIEPEEVRRRHREAARKSAGGGSRFGKFRRRTRSRRRASLGLRGDAEPDGREGGES